MNPILMLIGMFFAWLKKLFGFGKASTPAPAPAPVAKPADKAAKPGSADPAKKVE